MLSSYVRVHGGELISINRAGCVIGFHSLREGFFLARTEFLRKHGFPDRGMIKAMDDVALGEMIQQVGGRLVPFTSDLLKIAKTDGKRRGEGMTLADGVLR